MKVLLEVSLCQFSLQGVCGHRERLFQSSLPLQLADLQWQRMTFPSTDPTS